MTYGPRCRTYKRNGAERQKQKRITVGEFDQIIRRALVRKAELAAERARVDDELGQLEAFFRVLGKYGVKFCP